MAEHNNVQRLREGYDAFAKGDLDTVRERFDENIVWHNAGTGILAGDYKGIDEVFGFFAKLVQETGGEWQQELHALLADDEHAVALVRQSGERKGKRFDQNVVHVWHMKDGYATEFWGFPWDQRAADDFWS